MLHSPLGASSMDRWSQCPASVRESVGKQGHTNAHAEEGSLAHKLAADWFTSHTKPEFPNKEMEECITAYYDYVQAQIHPHDRVFIEHQFDLSAVHPGCFGTCDVVIWMPDSRRLMVIDLKYGAGKPVFAVQNPQLLYYALGALLTIKAPVTTVSMVIFQPRLILDGDEGIRSEVIDAIDLLDFSVDLRNYATATQQSDAPFHPGPYCRYCLANPGCPALEAEVQAIAKTSFSAPAYDPAKLAEMLDKRPVLEAALKALDEFAYAEAEAGRCPPGYKLVDKRATRKWKDGDALKNQFFGQFRERMFEPIELKSPAQMEKIIAKADLAPYIEAVSSGRVLVHESDKRPPAKLLTAAEVFL